MVEKERPWKNVCSSRCYTAKGSKCKCKCHGLHHQKGLLKSPENDEDFKRLADMKTKNPEVTEKLCSLLEEALVEHPEWKKYVTT